MEDIKPSGVLRRAAKRLHQNKCVGCCAAIKWQEDVPKKTVNRAYQLFYSLYKPADRSENAFWFHDGYDEDAKPIHRKHRIMALLLTADIAESVGE